MANVFETADGAMVVMQDNEREPTCPQAVDTLQAWGEQDGKVGTMGIKQEDQGLVWEPSRMYLGGARNTAGHTNGR